MFADCFAKDRSYKIAFILAVTLHVMLAIFLLIKFTESKQFVLESTNIIQAVVISDIASPQPAPIPPSEKKEIQPATLPPPPAKTTEPQVKNNTAEILKKYLAAEQAREAKELKKQAVLQKQAILQKALQQEMAKEKSALNAARQSAKSRGEVDKYKALIIQAIASEWIVPEGIAKNATCKLLITVAPKGMVLDVQLLESSGNVLLDRSAKTAVLKAAPLPVPDGALFDNFRTIRLTVRPEGISG